MMKIFKKLIVVAVVVSLALETFAAERIVTGGVDSMMDNGPGAMMEVLVAGDSYAQRFYNDEKNKELRLHPFFQEGHTIEENWEKLFDAFTAYKKILFLSISVNDRHRNTHPSEFENQLRNLFAVAKMMNKYVIVHSYMFYGLYHLESIMKKIVKVEGMMCPHCEGRVKEAFEKNAKVDDRLVFMINYIEGKKKNGQ